MAVEEGVKSDGGKAAGGGGGCGGDWSRLTITSCTYQDRVIFLLSPLKPSEEKFKESLTKDAKSDWR